MIDCIPLQKLFSAPINFVYQLCLHTHNNTYFVLGVKYRSINVICTIVWRIHRRIVNIWIACFMLFESVYFSTIWSSHHTLHTAGCASLLMLLNMFGPQIFSFISDFITISVTFFFHQRFVFRPHATHSSTLYQCQSMVFFYLYFDSI